MSVVDVDAAKFTEVPDVDVITVWKFAGFEQDHQIGAAGERLPDSGIGCKQRQNIVQGSRRGELIVWNVSSHLRAFVRGLFVAWSTDSNIFM